MPSAMLSSHSIFAPPSNSDRLSSRMPVRSTPSSSSSASSASPFASSLPSLPSLLSHANLNLNLSPSANATATTSINPSINLNLNISSPRLTARPIPSASAHPGKSQAVNSQSIPPSRIPSTHASTQASNAPITATRLPTSTSTSSPASTASSQIPSAPNISHKPSSPELAHKPSPTSSPQASTVNTSHTPSAISSQSPLHASLHAPRSLRSPAIPKPSSPLSSLTPPQINSSQPSSTINCKLPIVHTNDGKTDSKSPPTVNSSNIPRSAAPLDAKPPSNHGLNGLKGSIWASTSTSAHNSPSSLTKDDSNPKLMTKEETRSSPTSLPISHSISNSISDSKHRPPPVSTSAPRGRTRVRAPRRDNNVNHLNSTTTTTAKNATVVSPGAVQNIIVASSPRASPPLSKSLTATPGDTNHSKKPTIKHNHHRLLDSSLPVTPTVTPTSSRLFLSPLRSHPTTAPLAAPPLAVVDDFSPASTSPLLDSRSPPTPTAAHVHGPVHVPGLPSSLPLPHSLPSSSNFHSALPSPSPSSSSLLSPLQRSQSQRTPTTTTTTTQPRYRPLVPPLPLLDTGASSSKKSPTGVTASKPKSTRPLADRHIAITPAYSSSLAASPIRPSPTVVSPIVAPTAVSPVAASPTVGFTTLASSIASPATSKIGRPGKDFHHHHHQRPLSLRPQLSLNSRSAQPASAPPQQQQHPPQQRRRWRLLSFGGSTTQTSPVTARPLASASASASAAASPISPASPSIAPSSKAGPRLLTKQHRAPSLRGNRKSAAKTPHERSVENSTATTLNDHRLSSSGVDATLNNIHSPTGLVNHLDTPTSTSNTAVASANTTGPSSATTTPRTSESLIPSALQICNPVLSTASQAGPSSLAAAKEDSPEKAQVNKDARPHVNRVNSSTSIPGWSLRPRSSALTPASASDKAALQSLAEVHSDTKGAADPAFLKFESSVAASPGSPIETSNLEEVHARPTTTSTRGPRTSLASIEEAVPSLHRCRDSVTSNTPTPPCNDLPSSEHVGLTSKLASREPRSSGRSLPHHRHPSTEYHTHAGGLHGHSIGNSTNSGSGTHLPGGLHQPLHTLRPHHTSSTSVSAGTRPRIDLNLLDSDSSHYPSSAVSGGAGSRPSSRQSHEPPSPAYGPTEPFHRRTSSGQHSSHVDHNAGMAPGTGTGRTDGSTSVGQGTMERGQYGSTLSVNNQQGGLFNRTPQASPMGQESGAVTDRKNTPPPARSRDDLSTLDFQQLLSRHEELNDKYRKVKKYYFDKDAQVQQLQNTLAHQRLAQSRTSLDDNEYHTRFSRLDGAINNLAFNIRKEWRAVPPWLAAYVNKDATTAVTKEMTAVGRACISRWLVDELFDRYFHPGLEPNLSSYLKLIERNLRRFAPPTPTDEEREALLARISNWRLSTLDGLQDMLHGPDAGGNRGELTKMLVEMLTADLMLNLKDPSPPGLEAGVVGIIELAVGIAANLPLESRDVFVDYIMPGTLINEDFMTIEGYLPALTNPGDGPHALGGPPATGLASGDLDRGSPGSSDDENDDLGAAQVAPGHKKKSMFRDLVGSQLGGSNSSGNNGLGSGGSSGSGLGGNNVGGPGGAGGSGVGLSGKRTGSTGRGGSAGGDGNANASSQQTSQAGQTAGASQTGVSQQAQGQQGAGASQGAAVKEERIRFAAFMSVEVKGKSMLIKAPVYR